MSEETRPVTILYEVECTLDPAIARELTLLPQVLTNVRLASKGDVTQLPAVQEAVAATRTGHVAVIGTKATIVVNDASRVQQGANTSGIATYSQAGAREGFGLLWTVVLTWPLMVAVQSVSARIGRVTGRGRLAGPGIRGQPPSRLRCYLYPYSRVASVSSNEG